MRATGSQTHPLETHAGEDQVSASQRSKLTPAQEKALRSVLTCGRPYARTSLVTRTLQNLGLIEPEQDQSVDCWHEKFRITRAGLARLEGG
jgi:hypothetical protein